MLNRVEMSKSDRAMVNSNFRLIRSENPMPTNDFELTVTAQWTDCPIEWLPNGVTFYTGVKLSTGPDCPIVCTCRKEYTANILEFLPNGLYKPIHWPPKFSDCSIKCPRKWLSKSDCPTVLTAQYSDTNTGLTAKLRVTTHWTFSVQ